VSNAELVLLPGKQAVVTGLDAPPDLPTRVYIFDRLYQITAPRIPLPPLAGTIKVIFNWLLANKHVAKNIWYLFQEGGTVDTSNTTHLKSLAEFIQNYMLTGSGLQALLGPTTVLQSVTCKDNGGTSAIATSSGPSMTGSGSAQAFPPQNTVCWSWRITASYRGGKPRTYVPGIVQNATLTSGDSQLSVSFTNSFQGVGGSLLTTMNAMTVDGGIYQMGTVSYHTGHAVRPTPIWRPFQSCEVHERLDSQRRRSGKEAGFPELP